MTEMFEATVEGMNVSRTFHATASEPQQSADVIPLGCAGWQCYEIFVAQSYALAKAYGAKGLVIYEGPSGIRAAYAIL